MPIFRPIATLAFSFSFVLCICGILFKHWLAYQNIQTNMIVNYKINKKIQYNEEKNIMQGKRMNKKMSVTSLMKIILLMKMVS